MNTMSSSIVPLSFRSCFGTMSSGGLFQQLNCSMLINCLVKKLEVRLIQLIHNRSSIVPLSFRSCFGTTSRGGLFQQLNYSMLVNCLVKKLEVRLIQLIRSRSSIVPLSFRSCFGTMSRNGSNSVFDGSKKGSSHSFFQPRNLSIGMERHPPEHRSSIVPPSFLHHSSIIPPSFLVILRQKKLHRSATVPLLLSHCSPTVPPSFLISRQGNGLPPLRGV